MQRIKKPSFNFYSPRVKIPKIRQNQFISREADGINIYIIMFSAILLVGIVTGRELFKALSIGDSKLISSFLFPITKSKAEERLSFVFLREELLVALSFLLGFSSIMQPALLGIIFFEGIGYGMSCSYMASLGEKDMLIYIICYLAPRAFLGMIIFFASARESIKYSSNYFNFMLFGREKRDMPTLSGRYAIKFLVLSFLTLGYTLIVKGLGFVYGLIS